MIESDINFITQDFVSEARKKREHKLKILTYVIAGLIFLAIGVSLTANFFVQQELNKLNQTKANLASRIEEPTNKKKEILITLAKNRLAEINKITPVKPINYKYLEIIREKLQPKLNFKAFSLSSKFCEINFEIDNYDNFNSFIDHLDDYEIDRNSFTVKETKFANGKYSISVSFLFL